MIANESESLDRSGVAIRVIDCDRDLRDWVRSFPRGAECS